MAELEAEAAARNAEIEKRAAELKAENEARKAENQKRIAELQGRERSAEGQAGAGRRPDQGSAATLRSEGAPAVAGHGEPSELPSHLGSPCPPLPGVVAGTRM